MNEAQFKTLFPNSSRDTINVNRGLLDTLPQPPVCDEPVAEAQGKDKDPVRCIVRVKSFRRRPLDTDNLCFKYFIDTLRYAGALFDDREEDIALEILPQVRVAKKAQERTEIEVIYP